MPQTFPDMAQGIPLIATATPIVYLSMFDPDGPAVIPKNAAAIGAAPHPVPLLWVVGKLDPIDRRGPEYAFDAAAKNPKSKYIEVFAGHLTTPLVARKQVVGVDQFAVRRAAFCSRRCALPGRMRRAYFRQARFGVSGILQR